LNRGQGNNKINDLKLLIMIEGINKIHHMNFLDNDLPDKCAQLIIADPPYFEVKGDFDFIWKSFDDYLKDVEKWAIECKRLLADNGTIFWYGSSKRIAYAQVIFDKYFNLINNLVWDKGSFMGLEESEGLRSFAPCTERILMYSNETYNLTQCVYRIRDYIRAEIEKAKGKIILKEINEALGTATNGGGVASACLSLDKTEPAMFTKEMYEKLQIWCYPYLRKEYEELRKEYEELRKEYEELRRPFSNHFKLQEILRFSNEATKTGAKYDHDTVKPESLTRALILTCSRPNDLVLVPFAGSGTECAMAAKENRNFWACDIEMKYVKMSNDRCREHLQTQ
jgi:DNA modification methylase